MPNLLHAFSVTLQDHLSTFSMIFDDCLIECSSNKSDFHMIYLLSVARESGRVLKLPRLQHRVFVYIIKIDMGMGIAVMETFVAVIPRQWG